MYDGTTTTLDTPVRLPSTPVGVVMFSVIEHVGAISGSSISIDQLTKLYTQPDGLPGKLAVGFQEGSASRLALFELLKQPGSTFQNRCPPPFGSAGCYESSYPEELEFLKKTPNTIGYMALNNVDGQHPAGYLEISVLNIGPVTPTLENVRDGAYKFTEVEHLYTSPQPSPLAKSFVEYLQQDLTSMSRKISRPTSSHAPARRRNYVNLATDCTVPHLRDGAEGRNSVRAPLGLPGPRPRAGNRDCRNLRVR